MELHLVRHGEAAQGAPDSLRRLTAAGRGEVERVARASARLGLPVLEIRHSGKIRAHETAEILAAALTPARGVSEMKGLQHGDDPEDAKRAIASMEGSLLFVGHLPHLGRLSSLLLVGNPERDLVAFGTGTLVSLSSEGTGKWILRRILTPESGE